MARVVNEFPVADAPSLLEPRDDVVLERALGDGTFDCVEGPFRHYRRHVDLDGATATQTVEFGLAVPYFAWLFVLPFRSALRKPIGKMPWWHPPDRFDARTATVLGALCATAVVFGYVNSLWDETVAFAADQFHASNSAQGVAGAAVRAGVVIALVLAAVADRRGRRVVVVWCTVAAGIVTATGALAPSLPWLAANQAVARALGYALFIVGPIIAAEEVPPGSRAYTVSVLALCAGLGAGVCVLGLRVADVGPGGWRALYLVPVVGVPIGLGVARHLPESRRFLAPHAQATFAGHGRRLWLLAAAGFLYSVFIAPGSQFTNRFLRHERHYSGGSIGLLSVVSGTPGVIGIVAGGRLADVVGRRPVAAVSLALGTVLSVVFFFVAGPALWIWSIVGTIVLDAAVPALGVYGPELFPTSLRGRANGAITVVSLAGSVTGLLVAGAVADRVGRIGPALAVVAAGPVLLALLVVVAFPETAGQELEAINPEDA